MSTTALSFRTEDATKQRLDELADMLQRSRNWVINAAIDSYLDLHEWQVEHIRRGIAATDAGKTLSTEEVRAQLATHHAQRKAGK